jgi:SAM-dependent methyltransferase
MAQCRFCEAPLSQRLIDLGMSPLCESYLPPESLNRMEPFYPLHVYVCDRCFLVQLEEYVAPETIFSEYAYFSSFSTSWRQHAKSYVDKMCTDLQLGGDSFVVEIGSNDGYLLEYFVQAGVPVLGVEPAANVAEAARKRGVPTLVRFFGRQTAAEMVASGRQPDLLLGANVLAQIPDLNDCVAGMRLLLKPGGVITIEFPHLLRLIEENQFDTIYHEHFYYFSLTTAERIFAAHGLTLFDCEELPTHGGSLRIYARHQGDPGHPVTERAQEMRAREAALGMNDLAYYRGFAQRVYETKRCLLEFLIEAKRKGKSVAGYGAPGKGNTLLNYCGIRTDFLDFTVDRNPYKHGKYLPGTHIPIHPPEKIWESQPDYLLILPWNLKNEIMAQMEGIRAWGGQFVVPIPTLEVHP